MIKLSDGLNLSVKVGVNFCDKMKVDGEVWMDYSRRKEEWKRL